MAKTKLSTIIARQKAEIAKNYKIIDGLRAALRRNERANKKKKSKKALKSTPKEKDVVVAQAGDTKRCSRCRATKPITEFSVKSDGVLYAGCTKCRDDQGRR